MHSSLRRAITATACFAAAVAVVAPTSAASAADPDLRASVANPVHVVAVTGTDNGLWVKYTDEANFRNLGGILTDAPAVALGYEADYFVGVGGDRSLWVRTLDRGWQRLGQANARCAGVSAVVSADLFVVACRGDDNAGWVAWGQVPSGDGIPTIGNFVRLGGVLKHGLSVIDAADYSNDNPRANAIYIGVGTDNRPYFNPGGGRPWQLADNTTCGGTLTFSEFGDVGACRNLSTDAMKTFHFNREDYPMTGRVQGRTGVAVDLEDGDTRHYALGIDGNIYVARQAPDGTLGGFRLFGGSGKFGISAASFS